jgi:hypothetical protein
MSNSVPKDEKENGTAKLIKGTATPAEDREEERGETREK